MTIHGGYGCQLLIDVPGLTIVARVSDLDFPEFEKILAPSTVHDSASGYAELITPGKRRLNQFSCTLNWDISEETHEAMVTAFDSDATVDMRVEEPEGDEGISFAAHILSVSRMSEQEEHYQAEILIQPSGSPTLYDIYYVDATSGSDSNGGNLSSDAWQTIAKVNGETFDPGDRILFKRGEIWRETLGIPSSGALGNPITFGDYGAGDKPIINAADIITGWTSSPTWQTDSLTTLINSTNGADDRNRRFVYTAGRSGTDIRVTLQAGSGGDAGIDGTSIGPRDGSTDDFASAPTRLLWSAGNTTTITAGEQKTSDNLTFAITNGNDYLVHIYYEDTFSYGYLSNGHSSYYQNSAPSDDTLTEDVSYTPSTTNYGVAKIEVLGSTTWQAALTTEPNQVFMDGTRLTKGADEDSLNDHEWYWTGDVLYVRDDTGDPDGSVVIEASARGEAIECAANTDFITIENISCKYGNLSNILINESDGCKLISIDSSYAYNSNITLWGAISTGLVEGCVLEYGADYGAGAGLFIGGGPNLIIVQDNICNNNGDHGLYVNQASNLIIRRNICYDNINGGIKLTSSASSQIYRNYCYDNSHGFIFEADDGNACEGNVTSNNIAYSNTKTGAIFLNASGGIDDNEFYHNHFVNNSHGLTTSGGIHFYGTGNTGNIFKNNIIYSDENLGADGWLLLFTDTTERDNQIFDYNIYYWLDRTPASGIIYDGTLRTFADWQGLGFDANGDEDNPDFVTDYTDLHLQSVSPCRGVGATGLGITDDYDGVVRGSPPDIGAYEYVA